MRRRYRRRIRSRSRAQPHSGCALTSRMRWPFSTVIALHDSGGLGGHANRCARLPRLGGNNCSRPAMQCYYRTATARANSAAMPRQGTARERGQRVVVGVRPQSSRNDGPDFRSAIAVLSGLPDFIRPRWSARVPTLLLDRRQGRRQFAVRLPPDGPEGARGRSALTRIEVYPGAPHDFDRAIFRYTRSRQRGCKPAGARPHRQMQTRARTRKSASRIGCEVSGCGTRSLLPRPALRGERVG